MDLTHDLNCVFVLPTAIRLLENYNTESSTLRFSSSKSFLCLHHFGVHLGVNSWLNSPKPRNRKNHQKSREENACEDVEEQGVAIGGIVEGACTCRKTNMLKFPKRIWTFLTVCETCNVTQWNQIPSTCTKVTVSLLEHVCTHWNARLGYGIEC